MLKLFIHVKTVKTTCGSTNVGLGLGHNFALIRPCSLTLNDNCDKKKANEEHALL